MCIELYVTYMYIVKNDTDVNKLAEIAFLGQWFAVLHLFHCLIQLWSFYLRNAFYPHFQAFIITILHLYLGQN